MFLHLELTTTIRHWLRYRWLWWWRLLWRWTKHLWWALLWAIICHWSLIGWWWSCTRRRIMWIWSWLRLEDVWWLKIKETVRPWDRKTIEFIWMFLLVKIRIVRFSKHKLNLLFYKINHKNFNNYFNFNIIWNLIFPKKAKQILAEITAN